MTAHSIRRAEPADLPAITRLTEAAYAPWIPVLGYPPLPVTEDYRPRIEGGEVWLLDEDDLAGLIVIETVADHCLIFSVAVAPDQQGRGHAIRLLDFAEAETRRRGLAEIRLYTNALMAQNIAFYVRHGYRETGRRPNPKRPGWTIVDMAKSLAKSLA